MIKRFLAGGRRWEGVNPRLWGDQTFTGGIPHLKAARPILSHARLYAEICCVPSLIPRPHGGWGDRFLGRFSLHQSYWDSEMVSHLIKYSQEATEAKQSKHLWDAKRSIVFPGLRPNPNPNLTLT